LGPNVCVLVSDTQFKRSGNQGHPVLILKPHKPTDTRNLSASETEKNTLHDLARITDLLESLTKPEILSLRKYALELTLR